MTYIAHSHNNEIRSNWREAIAFKELHQLTHASDK